MNIPRITPHHISHRGINPRLDFTLGWLVVVGQSSKADPFVTTVITVAHSYFLSLTIALSGPKLFKISLPAGLVLPATGPC